MLIASICCALNSVRTGPGAQHPTWIISLNPNGSVEEVLSEEETEGQSGYHPRLYCWLEGELEQ